MLIGVGLTAFEWLLFLAPIAYIHRDKVNRERSIIMDGQFFAIRTSDGHFTHDYLDALVTRCAECAYC